MAPTAKAPPSIAATSTLAMVRTAMARGVAVADLLDRAGLSLESLEDPDARIPGATVLGIWSALRERTADPALQLLAPATLPFGAYRVVDYLVAASATVGDGVRRFADYFSLIADALSLDIVDEGGGRCLRLATVDGGAVPPVYVDYVFAALVSRIRMRIRPALSVRRVELRLPEPVNAAPYREVFRAPVHFGAGNDLLCFTEDEWTAPMDSADAALVPLLEEHARILARRIPRAGAGFRNEVQQALASTLPDTSAESVARTLNVSVRTLQRRLVAEGTTFRGVSEAVRSRLAEEYLSDPKVAVTEVAYMLGFSEESAFTRAFRRWTGESPSRWRRGRARPGAALGSGSMAG